MEVEFEVKFKVQWSWRENSGIGGVYEMIMELE
jgi:hypothetical protein